MAVTYAATYIRNNVWGAERAMQLQFLATGTYTSGGDSITPAQCGLDTIDCLIPVLDTGAGAQTNGVGVLAWNTSTNTLQIFVQGTAGAGDTMVELTGGTTVTGLGFTAIVIGVD